jgi:hypothetical protein
MHIRYDSCRYWRELPEKVVLLWGQKSCFLSFILSDFGYSKDITGAYVMESRGGVCIMIEEVKSNRNICNKAGFTTRLCK